MGFEFNVLKDILQILELEKLSFKTEGEIKTLLGREFVFIRSAYSKY